MKLNIYTNRKFEKQFKNWIADTKEAEGHDVSDWNAALFYLLKKKCILFTHRDTKYNVIVTDIKTSDNNQINSLFSDAFRDQLAADGILIDSYNLDWSIDAMNFLPTDNNRSMTGFQNQRFRELDYWKYEHADFLAFPTTKITSAMNRSPFRIGKGFSPNVYRFPAEEMASFIQKLSDAKQP
jgi:hypothetical protein